MRPRFTSYSQAVLSANERHANVRENLHVTITADKLTFENARLRIIIRRALCSVPPFPISSYFIRTDAAADPSCERTPWIQ